MLLTVLFVILVILGLILLVWIAWRKLPQLKIVDPSSSKAAKVKGVKYEILRKRFQRVSEERLSTVGASLKGPFKWIQDGVRSAAAKLVALEKSYVARGKSSGKQKLNQEQLRSLVTEARRHLDNGEYDKAEKILVEVLSLDPKNLDAYEYLGRLYIHTKNIDNAKESFRYLQRLAPQDASVLAALGEIANLENDVAGAYTYFSRAKNISPNNPKYLDFFIEAAIKKGDVMEATIALNHLREVNSDNQKISTFEERIEEVRVKNKAI